MTQMQAAVWAQDLARLDIELAVEALQLHYQESTDWAMPRHVLECARRIRDRRARELRMQRPAIAPQVITLNRAEFDRMTVEAIEQHRASS